MRISELSRRSGVPIATIKYYLREDLLHSGELTAATQAHYDDSHLGRLRLIRALLGPGRLSIAAIKGVLAVVDDPPEAPHQLLGGASAALAAEDREEVDLGPAAAIVQQLGWRIEPGTTEMRDLALALRAIDEAELRLLDGGVERYAEVIGELAVAELDTVSLDSPERAVRQAVLGTILIEPLLLALRRLALQEASIERFGGEHGPDRH